MTVFLAAAAAVREGRKAALATVIGKEGSAPRTSGARMLIHADGTIVGTIGGGAVEHRVIAAALDVMRDGRPMRWRVHLTRDLGMCCGGEMEIYIEPLEPQEPLYILGAGHVAHAAAPMLVALGYRVTVIDERDSLLTPERFPGCVTILEDPLEVLRTTPPDPTDLYLIVTHDHRLDEALLEALLPRPAAWIGMIGSRAKVTKFFLRLRARGVDPALFPRLSAPVGLDLGAESPAEIAVSIAAELVRLRRGQATAPWPLSHDPIPARTPTISRDGGG